MMKIYEDDKGDIKALRSSKKFDTRAPVFLLTAINQVTKSTSMC